MSSSASAVSVSPSSDEHSLFSVSSLTNGCDVQLVGQHQQSQAPNNNNNINNNLLSSNSSSSVNGLGSGGGGGGGGGNGSNSGSPPQSAQSQSFTDVGHLGRIFHECRSRLLVKQKNLEELTGRLQAQYGKAQGDVGRSYQTLQAAVEKGRNDLMKELDDVYNARIVSLTIFTSKIEENLHKIEQILLYMEQQQQNAAAAASDGSASPNINADMYSCKSFIDNKLQAILNIDLDSSVHSHELEFVLNYHLVQALVQSNFGSIRSSPNGSNNGGGGGGQQGPAGGNNNGSGKQAIGRTGSSGFGSGGSSLSSNGFADHSESLSSRFNQMSMSNGAGNGNGLHHQQQQPSSNHHGSHHNQSSNNNHNHHNHNHHSNNNNNRSLNSSVSESLNLFGSGYDKWSQGGNGMVNGHGLGGGGGGGGGNHHHHHHQHQHSRGNSNSSPDSALFTHWSNAVGPDGLDGLAADPMLDLNSGAHLNSHGHIGSGLGNAPSATSLSDALSNVSMGGGGGGGTPTSNSSGTVMPIKSQVQRQKMIYHCKFGEFGIMEGQFTEPSGVAVNAQNDIIVADTNNHRIQIFDKDGRFKFQFGECGKRDGQLLYPNRVAVVKQSGDIIVTERSPTHQIQVYNQYGQFVRKFGADILQHPRGVTVDHKGNIIIVECKVMRVIIFDLAGNVFHKFGCSKHLEFPNGVVVNDKQEIFISDNRAHCVKVFSYGGVFLRNIGGEGLTNYPIGVCINDNGEILVADNHNNFNITIFTQEGALVNALESKVKHSQCFDVALMDDNSVVLASKDYRIYIYRYLQLQSLATAVATSGIC